MIGLWLGRVLLVIRILSNGAVTVKKAGSSQQEQWAQWLPTASPPPTHGASYVPPHGTRFEPDLTELILLSGDSDSDIAITDKALREIGYERGIRLEDVAPQGFTYTDHAWTFRKGAHCVAAFAGTNDPEDFLDASVGVIDTGLNLANSCGFNINKGIADELDGYRQGSNWTRFIDYLNDPQCEMVTAIGHSLGGALASIFAACANIGELGFGSRKDFGLITFGSFPISIEPLYSGTPGTPFRGTRYHLSGLDGGMDMRDTLPARTKFFRLDLLHFYKALAKMYEIRNITKVLTQASAAVRWLPDGQVENFWSRQNMSLHLLPVMFRIHEIFVGQTDEPSLLTLQPLLRELMLNMTKRGDITYYFDPVSSWMSVYGFKHALVDYQPISNHMLGDVILNRVPAIEAPMYPKVDPFMSIIGTMLVEPKFPNHSNCCYYRGTDCLHHFEDTYTRNIRACSINLFR